MASIYLLNPGIQKVSEPFTPMLVQDLKHIGIVGLKYTWSHGVFKNDHRKSENFLWSKFVVFDIDNKEGEIYTIDQAINDWCDSQCIIVASRNHQKPKGTYPPQDRFRIITEWEEVITDLETFKYSYELACEANPAFDTSCKDGTHMFYPHRAVLYANYEGFKQPVKKRPARPDISNLSEHTQAHFARLRKILPSQAQSKQMQKVDRFLKKGVHFSNGRNNSIFITARMLRDEGYTFEKILELIMKAPFDRSGMPDGEIWRAVKNGYSAK